MKRSIALLGVLVACGNPSTSSEKSSASQTTDSPPARAPDPIAAPEEPLAPERNPVVWGNASKVTPSTRVGWRWNHHTKEAGEGQEAVAQRVANQRFVLSAQPKRDGLSLRRETDEGSVTWQVHLDPIFVPAGAIVASQEDIIVVGHSAIASGATLFVFDPETGKERHRKELEGLGPVRHSKYRNEVQLDLRGDLLIVYGQESQGRYSEVYELGTWKRLKTERVDDDLAQIPWSRSDTQPKTRPVGPVRIEASQGYYEFEPRRNPDPSLLARYDQDGNQRWNVEVPGDRHCQSAVGLETKGSVFLARYCRSSSGGQLIAHSADDGSVLHLRDIEGLGAVSHSEYWNDIEFGFVHDHVVLFGKEAYGRYIEVVDPASGELITLRSFRD